MTELTGFLGVTVMIAAVGIVVGMLLAPRLVRMGDADDEETGDRDDPNA